MQWLPDGLGRLWTLAATLPFIGLVMWYVFWGKPKHRKEVEVVVDNDLIDDDILHQPKRHFVPPVLVALALILLSVVVAKPLQTELVAGESRAAVVIIVDASDSMLCEDVQPVNRITAVKTVVRQVVETAPSGLNIGLVTFGAEATLLHRPIQDRTALLNSLDAIETERGGTRTGEGVFAALNAAIGFATNGEPVQLFLISDGWENAEGSTMQLPRATEEVVAAGYLMNTAAYGTKEGFCGGSTQEPDYGAMQTAAKATGGEYVEAATAEQLARLFESIPEAISYTERQTLHGGVTAVFVASAIGLVGLAAVLAKRWGIWFQK